jgi:hypothetical protein
LNIISSANAVGISLSGARDVTIRENSIGHPYPAGSFADRIPNWIGISLDYSGDVTIDHNGIADNIKDQIVINGSKWQTRIENNQIGSLHTDYTTFPSHGDGINNGGGVVGSVVEILDNDIWNLNGDGIDGGASLIEGNRIWNNKENGIRGAGAVKGNIIKGNTQNGIVLRGGNGPEMSVISSNTIKNNGENGVLLDNAHYYVIGKNTIGISDGYAADAGNGLDGIRIVNGSSHNLIGGAVSEDGNRIGCNRGNGIYIGGSGTRENDVAGNILGLEQPFDPGVAPLKAGNHKHGIALYDNAEANNIGLSGSIINANIILDSHWRGIAVINSNHNRIFGNLVGTDKQKHDWGNAYSGIQIVGNNNEVKYNTVAFNGYGPSPPQAGIVVQGAGSYGNHLSENSIFYNGAAGIDLVDGGNQNLQPPLIVRNGRILSGTTYPAAIVEFFSGQEKNEGKYFEGSTLADNSGNFSWQINGHVKGKFITATTTNFSILSTSEFSAPVRGYIFPWPMFLPAIVYHR